MNIEVLYEDNHIICAVKPRGVLSQPDDTGDDDMLTLLKSYIKTKYAKPGDVYLGLVHRLDRPVGGVMVFARTSKAAGRLSALIRGRKVTKIYYVVVLGDIRAHIGAGATTRRLEHMIYKDKNANMVSVQNIHNSETAEAKEVRARNAGGTDKTGDAGTAKAILEYSLLAYRPYSPDRYTHPCHMEKGLSLVRVGLVTGRPHQIRAQFAHIGYPVIGDRKYGAAGQNAGAQRYTAPFVGFEPAQDKTAPSSALPKWPAIWAYSLQFAHPVRGCDVKCCETPPDEYPWSLFTDELNPRANHL